VATPAQKLVPETAVADAGDQLGVLLEAIDEAFFRMGTVRDAGGRIVDFVYQYCNRAALTLQDRGREEVVGRRLLELFPSHETSGLFDAYARVVETGEPLRYEFTFDEGGVAGEFEVVVSRAGDGYVLAGHDITERKRLEREVATLTQQLQTALASRIVIEQAKGYVASATGTDPAVAFYLIRRYARNHNLKLPDLCRAVIAGEVPELTGNQRP